MAQITFVRLINNGSKVWYTSFLKNFYIRWNVIIKMGEIWLIIIISKKLFISTWHGKSFQWNYCIVLAPFDEKTNKFIEPIDNMQKNYTNW